MFKLEEVVDWFFTPLRDCRPNTHMLDYRPLTPVLRALRLHKSLFGWSHAKELVLANVSWDSI